MSRGLFYARLEDRDWKFLHRLGDAAPFDAAILKASYLAPYPDDDPRHGESPDRLSTKLVEREWAWGLDPATAPHGHPRALEWTAPRARSCSLAQAVDLPWTPAKLSDPELAGELIDTAVAMQSSSRAIAAPYLEVAGVDDPEVEANCSLLSLTAERAADQRVLAYLQTLGSRLADGSAASIAERYVDAGAETVFIRIRRFALQDLKQVLAYLELVARIERAGARAVADSVGHFGPVAVAGGAYGFSAGARFFRKVPGALLQRPSERSDDDDEKDSGGGPPVLYEHPGQLTGVRASKAGSHLSACPEPGCRAENGEGKTRYLREHNLHEFRRLARQAGAEGFDFAKTLRAIGSLEAVLWADALDQRAAQRRAA
jgi:hypothetical protein